MSEEVILWFTVIIVFLVWFLGYFAGRADEKEVQQEATDE